jgi:hypothetical protein
MQTLSFQRDDGSTFELSLAPNETKVAARKERIVALPTALFALRGVKTLWVRT